MSATFSGTWSGTVTASRECRIEIDHDNLLLTVDGQAVRLAPGDKITIDHKIELFDGDHVVRSCLTYTFPKKMKSKA